MSFRSVALLIYIILGFFVANDHNYLNHLNDLGRIFSAILAVILWPLVVLGVDLHIGNLPDIDINR